MDLSHPKLCYIIFIIFQYTYVLNCGQAYKELKKCKQPPLTRLDFPYTHTDTTPLEHKTILVRYVFFRFVPVSLARPMEHNKSTTCPFMEILCLNEYFSWSIVHSLTNYLQQIFLFETKKNKNIISSFQISIFYKLKHWFLLQK